MNEIREQIVLTSARASYLSEQPDTTDSIMHRTNAAIMENLLAFYEEADGIIAESHGVDGWHLNGDVASWDEFEDLIAASNAVQTSSDCPHCDDGVYLTPDDNMVDCEYCNGE